MSFLSPSRCVLILGDEGLQIYNVGRLNAKFIDYLLWETDQFETSLGNLISKECKKKPIVILNDMVEQHYRKERIPKVSIMDKGNIIKRRLSVAFPNYRIRAALKLKDKKSIAEAGKGSAYLFAAVPNSDPFVKMMEGIRRSNAPIVGFYLLPVEASAMVKDISDKLMKSQGRRRKSIWTIFMGQHKGGGLRQVVTRNGELALTRITPIVDTDIEPALWANEVAGELTATMSYLARFGYQESDGLDIIIVANDAAQESLHSQIQVESNLQILSSQEIARVINTPLGIQEDLRYADPLYAAYLGRKTKFLLPMQSASLDRLTQPRRVASFLLLGLLVGFAYFGFSSFVKGKAHYELNQQLEAVMRENGALKEEYNLELDNKKALGYDFVYVNNAIEIFNELQSKKIKPLPVMREIGIALGPDIHIDKIDVEYDEERVEEENVDYGYMPEAEVKMQAIMDATITLSFPSELDPAIGVEKILNLQNKLSLALPDYEVSIIKQVADLSYTGNFVGEAGGTENSQESDDYVAEINIRGAVK